MRGRRCCCSHVAAVAVVPVPRWSRSGAAATRCNRMSRLQCNLHDTHISSSTHDEHSARRSDETRKGSSASATWLLIAIGPSPPHSPTPLAPVDAFDSWRRRRAAATAAVSMCAEVRVGGDASAADDGGVSCSDGAGWISAMLVSACRRRGRVSWSTSTDAACDDRTSRSPPAVPVWPLTSLHSVRFE